MALLLTYIPQTLPQNPELPADLYTSCLTTTVRTALHFWFHQQKINNIRILDCIEYLDKIPGMFAQRNTMAGKMAIIRSWYSFSVSPRCHHPVFMFPIPVAVSPLPVSPCRCPPSWCPPHGILSPGAVYPHPVPSSRCPPSLCPLYRCPLPVFPLPARCPLSRRGVPPLGILPPCAPPLGILPPCAPLPVSPLPVSPLPKSLPSMPSVSPSSVPLPVSHFFR